MTANPAVVDPILLIWARRTANLEPVAAARKLKVTQTRLAAWEAGTAAPTISELRRAASVYKRSLAVFFLAEPPTDFDTLRDFRRQHPGVVRNWSIDLHAEYRRALAQREAVLDVLELDGRQPSSKWTSVAASPRVRETAISIRNLLLEIAPLPEPKPRASAYEHLNYWVSAIEGSGIIVTTTAGGRVSSNEMRAFSLYFDETPVITLNGADWPRGRLFSALHEFAHLTLRTGGLCDTSTDEHASSSDRGIEALCNAIAAEVLMPTNLVLAHPLVKDHAAGESWALRELIEAARPFGASVESFLRRLVTLGRLPIEAYEAFLAARTEKERRGDRAGSGSFYPTKARDMGRGYVRMIASAYRRNVIDSTTASTYLDVKVDQITSLAQAAGE